MSKNGFETDSKSLADVARPPPRLSCKTHHPLRPVDPIPQTGLCRCSAALWYARAQEVGQQPYFHCGRCRSRYRPREDRWTPGAESSLTIASQQRPREVAIRVRSEEV